MSYERSGLPGMCTAVRHFVCVLDGAPAPVHAANAAPEAESAPINADATIAASLRRRSGKRLELDLTDILFAPGCCGGTPDRRLDRFLCWSHVPRTDLASHLHRRELSVPEGAGHLRVRVYPRAAVDGHDCRGPNAGSGK